uniref:Uncharacterized protein n=1 Tax=Aegilops tauschii subsp. strangulata TaxID=200361 RepID=A0A453N0Q5_AEGTS
GDGRRLGEELEDSLLIAGDQECHDSDGGQQSSEVAETPKKSSSSSTDHAIRLHTAITSDLPPK